MKTKIAIQHTTWNVDLTGIKEGQILCLNREGDTFLPKTVIWVESMEQYDWLKQEGYYEPDKLAYGIYRE